MNKNVQRETNPHQPVSQTTTSQWVSTSRSHHCSFAILSRQRRSGTSAHKPSVCLSCSYQHQEHRATRVPQGRNTVSSQPSQFPPASTATGHNQAQPRTLRAGDSSSHRERAQMRNLFREAMEFCLEGCQVRKSSKNRHHLLHRY